MLKKYVILKKYVKIISSFFLFYFMASINCVPAEETIEREQSEIKELVKLAVEDTGWLFAPTQQDMNRLLAVYYEGPFLSEISQAAWTFKTEPTGWESTIKAENIEVYECSGIRARVGVDILDIDEAGGGTLSNRVEYSLVNTEKGWRITGIRMQ